MSTMRQQQLLLVLLLSLVAVMMPAAQADAAGPSGAIEDVWTSPDGVLVFSASNVPEQAKQGAPTVQVTVNGAAAEARVQDGAVIPGKHPRRVAVLAVDTSGSMRGTALKDAQSAALAFAKAVPDDVLVGLVAFDDAARVVLPPTHDREQLRNEIRGLAARGSTSLYDALVLSAQQLGTQGSRSLVVLTDGADTASRTTATRAAHSLRTTGASIDLVAFRTDGAHASTLRTLASGTGARVLSAADRAQLAGTFTDAALAFDQRMVLTVPALAQLDRGQHTIGVTMRFGSVEVSSTRAVTVDALATREARVSWQLLVLLVLVFLALLGLGVAALLPRRTSRAADRIAELEQYSLSRGGRSTVAVVAAAPGSMASSLLRVADRVIQRRGVGEQVALQLDRASLRLRPHEWLVVRACSALTGSAVVALLTGWFFVGVAVGGLLGWLGSAAVLGFRARKRVKEFEVLLPDALQLVASSLQAGFSLPQALDATTRDGRAALSTELSRALNEAQLGVPLEEALDRVAERMDSKDFRWAVMAIRIQREVGGNLAEVLRATVTTIRERGALARQVRALSAEGRMSMYLLMALPVLMLGFLVAFRGEYVQVLWTHPLGMAMSAVAAALMTIGYFWMRNVVRVEV